MTEHEQSILDRLDAAEGALRDYEALLTRWIVHWTNLGENMTPKALANRRGEIRIVLLMMGAFRRDLRATRHRERGVGTTNTVRETIDAIRRGDDAVTEE
jgi:hypothetical protein